jgi:hypothetical protein
MKFFYFYPTSEQKEVSQDPDWEHAKEVVTPLYNLYEFEAPTRREAEKQVEAKFNLPLYNPDKRGFLVAEQFGGML